MPRNDSEQRRRILEAAVRVFAEHGWKGATIRMVGKAAGVNSALMYYYFEDKEALFLEAVRFVLSEFLDALDRAQHPFRSATDRLEFLVGGVLGYYRANPERMRMMAMMLTLHAESFARVMSRFLPGRSLVPLRVIQEGIAAGHFRRQHPIEIWWHIMGVCLFTLVIDRVRVHMDSLGWPIPPPPFDPAEQQARIVETLRVGLAEPAKRERKGRMP